MIETELTAALPFLRAYAKKLTRNETEADDLVQDTALRVLRSRDRFEEGTNFQGWVGSIMYHLFLDDRRTAWNRHVHGYLTLDDIHPAAMTMDGAQEHCVELIEVHRALQQMPPDQRAVIVAVGVLGHEYEEAARRFGVPVGTVRSRLSRGRAELQERLGA